AQRQRHGGREAGAAPEAAQAIAHVLAEVLQKPPGPRLAAGLLGRLEAAEPQERRASRLLRRQAVPDVRLGLQLEVVAQLVVHLLLPAAPEAEDARHASHATFER